jgi:hypothetical protein
VLRHVSSTVSRHTPALTKNAYLSTCQLPQAAVGTQAQPCTSVRIRRSWVRHWSFDKQWWLAYLLETSLDDSWPPRRSKLRTIMHCWTRRDSPSVVLSCWQHMSSHQQCSEGAACLYLARLGSVSVSSTAYGFMLTSTSCYPFNP